MAEFVTADWESHVADYDAGRTGSRRLMAWEVGQITADPDALRAKAAAQPHDPSFRPFAERALAAGIPVEVVSDGFGFFIEPALAALGVGQLPVVTAATTFGPDGAADRVPQRQPRLLRVRDLQAQPGARAPGGGAGGRVHRRRAVGPLRRRLQRRGVREGVAGADLPRRGLGVPALDRRSRRSTRGSRVRSRRSPPTRRRCPGPHHRPLFCGAEVWGPGRFDPAPPER